MPDLIKNLTDSEFKETFSDKMADVTETARPVVDIWQYVGELANQNSVDKYVLENKLVEKVYRNITSTFDHILLLTREKNIFVVIVVDLTEKNIYGHYVLDLNKEYGLTE